MSKILCMWSGGLDSTGALYALLTEPEYKDYDIHVHSMTLWNVEKRAKHEFTATKEGFEWFKDNCRPFEFTRCDHEYNFMSRGFIWDADFVMFMAGEIAFHEKEYEKIAFGATKSDIDNQHYQASLRITRADAIRNAVCPDGLEKIYPVSHLTKKEIWDMLPKDLRELTWSCRTPKNGQPCGRCITCEDLKDIG